MFPLLLVVLDANDFPCKVQDTCFPPDLLIFYVNMKQNVTTESAQSGCWIKLEMIHARAVPSNLPSLCLLLSAVPRARLRWYNPSQDWGSIEQQCAPLRVLLDEGLQLFTYSL